VAVVIGVDPLTLLSSQAILPIDTDELEVAGALHGAALPVVKCLTSEIRVPAHAEIVIEGRILVDERAMEGPFGEFPRYYSDKAEREVIAVDVITHRREPLFHTIVPAEMEHLLLGAIPREATLLSVLQKSHPDVMDVHLSVGGVCRYHLFVRLHKRLEGQPKNVIAFALGAHADIKHVVVVDEDVDVHDPRQVEWAVATRFQADRDLVVISGARGSILDPSTTVHASAGEEGISSKMGLDATRPLRFEGHVFTRVAIPGEADVDVSALLARGVDDATLQVLRLG
jgi:2,5-furandicarboxylate decarboxylase 1